MASRRQVRQAAVQLLYARASTPDNPGGEHLWELINDRDYINLDKASVKILSHLQQGRQASAEKLQKILTDAAGSILSIDRTEKLAKELKSLSDSELKFVDSIRALKGLTKANLGGWRIDLRKLLLESDRLRKIRAGLLPRLEPLPPLELAEIEKIFAKLETYDARAHMVHFPQQYPDQRDLTHLNASLAEMKSLETEVVDLVKKVEDQKEPIDTLIGKTSTNFDLSRLSKVDHAIMSLAVWEILHRPDLDNAISINEGIELARAFSGEEAASFVNGILDQIAKTKPST